mmetsp:Transcript_12127/g.29403  ORF Transcript_12127/g.29403 Transcript_12127/m.29403 type:complete len:1081 (+) Transcript_12127:451-3693(+)
MDFFFSSIETKTSNNKLPANQHNTSSCLARQQRRPGGHEDGECCLCEQRHHLRARRRHHVLVRLSTSAESDVGRSGSLPLEGRIRRQNVAREQLLLLDQHVFPPNLRTGRSGGGGTRSCGRLLQTCSGRRCLLCRSRLSFVFRGGGRCSNLSGVRVGDPTVPLLHQGLLLLRKQVRQGAHVFLVGRLGRRLSLALAALASAPAALAFAFGFAAFFGSRVRGSGVLSALLALPGRGVLRSRPHGGVLFRAGVVSVFRRHILLLQGTRRWRNRRGLVEDLLVRLGGCVFLPLASHAPPLAALLFVLAALLFALLATLALSLSSTFFHFLLHFFKLLLFLLQVLGFLRGRHVLLVGHVRPLLHLQCLPFLLRHVFRLRAHFAALPLSALALPALPAALAGTLPAFVFALGVDVAHLVRPLEKCDAHQVLVFERVLPQPVHLHPQLFRRAERLSGGGRFGFLFHHQQLELLGNQDLLVELCTVELTLDLDEVLSVLLLELRELDGAFLRLRHLGVQKFALVVVPVLAVVLVPVVMVLVVVELVVQVILLVKVILVGRRRRDSIRARQLLDHGCDRLSHFLAGQLAWVGVVRGTVLAAVGVEVVEPGVFPRVVHVDAAGGIHQVLFEFVLKPVDRAVRVRGVPVRRVHEHDHLAARLHLAVDQHLHRAQGAGRVLGRRGAGCFLENARLPDAVAAAADDAPLGAVFVLGARGLQGVDVAQTRAPHRAVRDGRVQLPRQLGLHAVAGQAAVPDDANRGAESGRAAGPSPGRRPAGRNSALALSLAALAFALCAALAFALFATLAFALFAALSFALPALAAAAATALALVHLFAQPKPKPLRPAVLALPFGDFDGEIGVGSVLVHNGLAAPFNVPELLGHAGVRKRLPVLFPLHFRAHGAVLRLAEHEIGADAGFKLRKALRLGRAGIGESDVFVGGGVGREDAHRHVLLCAGNGRDNGRDHLLLGSGRRDRHDRRTGHDDRRGRRGSRDGGGRRGGGGSGGTDNRRSCGSSRCSDNGGGRGRGSSGSDRQRTLLSGGGGNGGSVLRSDSAERSHSNQPLLGKHHCRDFLVREVVYLLRITCRCLTN